MSQIDTNNFKKEIMDKYSQQDEHQFFDGRNANYRELIGRMAKVAYWPR